MTIFFADMRTSQYSVADVYDKLTKISSARYLPCISFTGSLTLSNFAKSTFTNAPFTFSTLRM